MRAIPIVKLPTRRTRCGFSGGWMGYSGTLFSGGAGGSEEGALFVSQSMTGSSEEGWATPEEISIQVSFSIMAVTSIFHIVLFGKGVLLFPTGHQIHAQHNDCSGYQDSRQIVYQVIEPRHGI